MTSVLLEITLILLLLIGNGVFAMAEIAILSASRGKLQAMADAGDGGAARALKLAESPDRFLSTVQIGITLAVILSSMFGGCRLAMRLAGFLESGGWLGPFADEIAFIIVIAALTFLSVVIGELLPKRLARRFPEAIASAMSGPMSLMSRFASPAVIFHSRATTAILKVFGIRRTNAEKMSKEDFEVLIREGLVSGTIEHEESRMMEGVFSFEKLDVYDIMIPRPKVVWIDVNASHEASWPKIVRSSQSYFPVYENERDNLVGVVSIKDCYAQLAAGIPVSFKHLMRPPQLVPETQKASATLELFRSSGIHVAFVLDEFGGVIGMVTLIDLMESIVGDVPSAEERRALTIQKRHDGSWLIDGGFEIEKLGDHLENFQTPGTESDEHPTIAGFVGRKIGRIANEGDRIAEGGWIFEVVDMDGIRIDKVIAMVDPDAPKPAPVEIPADFPIA